MERKTIIGRLASLGPFGPLGMEDDMAFRRAIAAGTAAFLAAAGIVVGISTPANAANYTSTITMSVNTTAPMPEQGLWFQGDVTVNGAVANGIAGRTVVLKRQDSAGVWSDILSTTTTASGHYSFPYTYVRAGRASECYHAYVAKKTGTANTWSYDATDAPICVNRTPWTSTITLSVNTTTPAPEQGIWFQGDVAVSGGAGISGRSVTLKRQDAPGVWSDILTVTTSASGHYSFPYLYVRAGRSTECYHAYVAAVPNTWTYDATDAPTCVTQTVHDTLVFTRMSPRIVETTDRSGPEPMANAAQIARVEYDLSGGARTIKVQSYDSASARWDDLESWDRSGSGLVYTRKPIWMGVQYRAIIDYSTGIDVIADLTGSGPAQLFADEFSYNVSDPAQVNAFNSTWAMRCGTGSAPAFPQAGGTCSRANRPYERHDWSAISLDGSQLEFAMLPQSDCMTVPSTAQCHVLDGHVRASSFNAPAPGLNQSTWIVARIKMDMDTPGQVGAFWTQSTGAYGEDDIVEYRSPGAAGGRITHTTHQTPDGSTAVSVGEAFSDVYPEIDPEDEDWNTHYHIFAVRWLKRADGSSSYVYYVDGRLVAPLAAVSDDPAQIILSNLTYTNFDTAGNFVTGTHRMLVDWVAVYQ